MAEVTPLLAAHQLIGTWRAEDEDYASLFTVSEEAAGLKVSALDPRENEPFVISNTRWGRDFVEFDTEMPSTDRRGHQIIKLEQDQVYFEFSFNDLCELQKIGGGKPYTVPQSHFEAALYPFIGVWRADEDDHRSEYEIGLKSGEIFVAGKDFIDGENFIISNISCSTNSIKFNSFIPSIGRVARLEIVSEQDKTILKYSMTLRLRAVRV